MKYLLSNGRTTEDSVKYIKDLILINMKLLPREIPYFDGGSQELIQDILEVNLESHVREVITSVINRIKTNFPKITISLESVEINSSVVTAKININNLTETYAITRYNKGQFN